MWKKLNSVNFDGLGIRWTRLPLSLSRYMFVNGQQNPGSMSVQRTGCTCYFQTYLCVVPPSRAAPCARLVFAPRASLTPRPRTT